MNKENLFLKMFIANLRIRINAPGSVHPVELYDGVKRFAPLLFISCIVFTAFEYFYLFIFLSKSRVLLFYGLKFISFLIKKNLELSGFEISRVEYKIEGKNKNATNDI